MQLVQTKSNYLSFWEYLKKIKILWTCTNSLQNINVDMHTSIMWIFEENQNPVDMHTSIMCINILQNIKAVAPKL